MDDEPDLPSTCNHHNNFPHQLPDQLAPSRKRPREYEPNCSSDPAFFSSDDFLDTSADDYLKCTKKKRKFRGTWWDKKPLEPQSEDQQGKRVFKRNIDSGIWLEEDDMDDLTELDPLATQLSTPHSQTHSPVSNPIETAPSDHNLAIKNNNSSGLPHDLDFNNGTTRRSDSFKPQKTTTGFFIEGPDEPPDTAEIRVRRCVDNGHQYVNLNVLNLQEINYSTLAPLKFIVKDPRSHNLLKPPYVYEPFLPELYLTLADNFLRSLPTGLFDLEMISGLSLRNNKLTEIPSIIGRLTNLKELNLSGNKLRFLPWELLSMILQGKLVNLILGINQLVQVDQVSIPKSKHPEAKGEHHPIETTAAKPLMPRFLAATAVTYFEVDSTRHYASPTPPSLLAQTKNILPAASSSYVPASPDADSVSIVPSLVEISLRSCTTNISNLNQMPDMYSVNGPEVLPRLIREALLSESMGGKKCSVCGRSYIVARTEWMEWWGFVDDDDDLPGSRPMFHGNLPLLRRGCSWQCVARGNI
ncbi:MAG: hypothetical protein M1812_005547 [Candelaria pacifica]|nr:MAG: hypothetical protein M1812_005547 [Candelaria pacifica]